MTRNMQIAFSANSESPSLGALGWVYSCGAEARQALLVLVT
jgi:hypothetical protein